MTLPSHISVQLPQWSAFANTLADAAAKITTHYFKRNVTVEYKGDDSPVTQADQETETALRQMIAAQFSTHGIHGEEHGIERADAELRWVIDPIDGTRAFIANRPTFVTLIALCYQNTPILGVIDQPIRKHRWLGVAGQKTCFNGEALAKLEAPELLATATLGTTDAKQFPADIILRFNHLRDAVADLRLSEDGYMYGRMCGGLSDGNADLVCEYGLKPHDFAALIPVIDGAGGIITDWQGQPITLTSKGDAIAASSKALHAQALAKLQP